MAAQVVVAKNVCIADRFFYNHHEGVIEINASILISKSCGFRCQDFADSFTDP